MVFRAEGKSIKARTSSELTLEEGTSAVGNSKNADSRKTTDLVNGSGSSTTNRDRVVPFMKLGPLPSALTISFQKSSETLSKPEAPPWEGDLRTIAVAICWGLFLALRKRGITPPYLVPTNNCKIKGIYQANEDHFYSGKAKIINFIGSPIIGQDDDEVLESVTSSKELNKIMEPADPPLDPIPPEPPPSTS